MVVSMRGSSLVLAAGSLGDSLLTLPALRVLQSRLEVTLAGTNPYMALGAELLGIREVIPLESLLQSLYASRQDPSLQREFFQRFPEVFLFFKEPDENLVSLLSTFSHAKVRQPTRTFREFLEQERWAGDYWLETVQETLESFSPLSTPTRLNLTPAFQKRGMEICRSFGMETPFLIHPGSGSFSKNAPLSFFREAAGKIIQEAGKQVLVVWGEAEEKNLKEIQETFSALGGAKILPQPLSLGDLAGVMSQACGYLGNDSGVTHLAAACGVKTFAVFVSTNPRIWAPPEVILLDTNHEGRIPLFHEI